MKNCLGVVFVMLMLSYVVMSVMRTSIANVVLGMCTVYVLLLEFLVF